MTWIQILGLVVLVVGIAAVFFANPKGGRPAAGTSLMTAARVTLAVIAVILAGSYLL